MEAALERGAFLFQHAPSTPHPPAISPFFFFSRSIPPFAPHHHSRNHPPDQ